MFWNSADIALCTDQGKRNNNEDCGGYFPSENTSTPALIMCLADGMGGHASGEIASKMAVDHLLSIFRDQGFAQAQTLLEQAIYQAHDLIRSAAEANNQHGDMGTTIAALIVLDNQLIIGHVGDSRAYHFRPHKQGTYVRRLTQDHLYLVDMLGMEETQAKFNEQGNVLSQALGMRNPIRVPIVTFTDFVPGDVLLLCSDGVSEVVSEPLMAAFLTQTNLNKAAHEIVSTAISLGSQDNCTVAVLRIPVARP